MMVDEAASAKCRKTIMVDTRGIREARHVRYIMNQAKKRGEPVLVGDRPWEKFGAEIYGTVRHEGDRFRMWYQAWPYVPPRGVSYLVAYAESKDGINWEKPDLGLVEFEGSKENNLTNLYRHQPSILFTGDLATAGRAGDDGGGDGDGRRYGAIGYVTGRLCSEMPGFTKMPGYYTAYSADGLNWQENIDAPNRPEIPHYGDVGSFIRDETDGSFIGTVKTLQRVGLATRRCVYYTQSRDFHNWTPPRLILAPDELDEYLARAQDFHSVDFYGMTLWRYPGLWLGFLWVFYIREPFQTTGVRNAFGEWGLNVGLYGRVEVQLAYSYDGYYWLRAPGRKPFIAWGERGDFDAGGIYTASHPVIVDDKMFIYYTGTRREHGCHKHPPAGGGDGDHPVYEISIGLAEIMRDRFLGFSSDGEGLLEIEVEPDQEMWRNSSIYVNASCPHGYVKAEILDENKEVLPGYSVDECTPFTGDAVRGKISWPGGKLEQAEKAAPKGNVIIRFHLYNADFWGFEV